MLCNGPYTPLQVPLPVGTSASPYLTHGSWVHATQHPKRHLDRFSRFCTVQAGRSLLYNGLPFPPKMPLRWGSGLPSNRSTWFLEPSRAHNPNDISIGSAVFCRAHYCDRQTDRQADFHTTRSVTIGSIYVVM